MQELVAQAAGVVSASKNKVGIAKAMGLVGFTAEEIKVMKWCQQVRRLSKKVVMKETRAEGTPVVPMPQIVAAEAEASSVSSLTSNSGNQSNNTPPSGSTTDALPTRRCILVEEDEPSNTSKVASVSKKNRRSSKQLQRMNAIAAATKARNIQAMKAATVKIHLNGKLSKNDPKRCSINSIVRDTTSTAT